ncbi:YifB family Mg chelatase-like AAA ATPase [Sandaracinobacter sp. RS1-74]|uniref:YifB family Mg chelatase-like AAA ATPase n=1 Tax=Sandaracinobacteroides sayramensis TaxID=2913411 RepID=UPI001EDA27B9|nr:YifB family Mg chelatase-like AAA ATPase [Sandaracinobacteroides sayramensis]MCG2840343.1 YifB family Mg chelatase-like AAA ATPase [Sandaracinobacteroides sayramensis]
MVARVATVAYLGLEARAVDVQVQLSSGLVSFVVVGLPDKAVKESRDRVTAAFAALNLSMPAKKITVNLAPADLEKAGSHYDLPIALGLLAAIGVVDAETLAHYVAVGELSLDGRVTPSPGVLLAAMHARSKGLGLICPGAQGPEAAWLAAADHGMEVVAAPDLHALVQHLKGTQLIPPPDPARLEAKAFSGPDFGDVKGQETPKRALEIAAAGGHNLAMCGPPGAGKSMMAAALPGILPPLDTAEALEVAMIASLAAPLEGGRIPRTRPFRSPHHSASMAALVGGGARARPGEVSLAHLGVLFLDELPEFQRGALDALRQPLERGQVEVARAALHVTYPARVQLIAAMNPCRCGHLADPALACSRAPRCAADYQAKLSGPLLDRIDIFIDIQAVKASDLALPPPTERSADVARRVAQARALQTARYAGTPTRTNAEAEGKWLETPELLEAEARQLLTRAAERLKLSARAWVRILRVARSIADLEGAPVTARSHIAEALSLRRQTPESHSKPT